MERTVVEYLANSLWQAPLLFAAAWLMLRIARPGVLAQHRLWLAVLALAVALPLCGIHSTAGDSIGPAQRTTIEQPAQVVSGLPAYSPNDAASNLLQNASPPRRSRWLVWPALVRSRDPPLRNSTIHWLLALYAAWIAFGLVRLARSWNRARQMVRAAQQTVLSEHAAALLDECCAYFGVSRPRVLLLSSPAPSMMASPVIVGAFHPALLLPLDFAQLTQRELKALLCHELAHLHRRDYLVNLLCLSASLPLSYHPAMAALHRRVRQTREMVCDAMAAEAMQSANGYARCLVVLAARMVERSETAEQLHAMGLFNKTVLEERVMKLLEHESKRNPRVRILRAAAGIAVMTVVVFTAAAFHLKPVVLAAQATTQPADNPITASAAAAGPAIPVAIPAAAPLIPAAVPAIVVPATPPAAAQAEPPAVATMPAPQAPTPTAGPSPSPAALPAPAPQVGSNPKPADQPQPKSAIAVAPHPMVVLSPEDKARIDIQTRSAIDQTMKDAHINNAEMQRQIAKQTEFLNSPTFKKQMADAQRQMAAARVNSAEMKQQMAKQMEFLNSPAFKKQMADAQRQMAMAHLDSAQYRQRMEAARKQLQQASQSIARTREQLQNTQLQKQLDDAQKAIDAASKAFSQ